MTITKKYRTLIIDDEKYARSDLKDLLSIYECIDIAGEAKNIKTAVKEIQKFKPDLIFLDIQFPGETGFDLFDKIDITAKVIFVTAYDEFALRAFEVNACDYLLKPVNPYRLALAIKRITENADSNTISKNVFKNDDSIYLQMNYKYYFVRIDSIIKITATDHYTEITTTKGLRGLTNKHLWEWKENLPKETFIQIHRSTIININFVEKIEKAPKYSSIVFMKNIEIPISISRRFASHIKKQMTL